jgi:hypothetical protein
MVNGGSLSGVTHNHDIKSDEIMASQDLQLEEEPLAA